ncbi:MAG: lycopene cyclase domain-containing protein [Brumimicrobium sp.]
MSLYLWINLLSFAGPFFLSFDKKVHFYTQWKTLIPSILIVGSAFIAWDIYYTQLGVWGFNEEHLSGIYVFNLPLEECLFFFTIPYACVFVYEVMRAYFPKYRPVNFSYYFSLVFTLSAFILSIYFVDQHYTFYGVLTAGIINWIIYFGFTPKWYPYFITSFVAVMIPFLIVNGVLTGAITTEPVVWYNQSEISGIRIYTIPIEDVYYNFMMLLLVVLFHEGFKKTFK